PGGDRMNRDDVSSQAGASGGGEQTQTGGPQDQPSPEELRAAMEEELKRVTVDDVLLQTVVSIVNLAGRRAGLVPGAEQERDLDRLQTAIDAVRARLPVLERRHKAKLGPIRDAVARLQMAYAQLRGGEPSQAPGGGEGGGRGGQGGTQAGER